MDEIQKAETVRTMIRHENELFNHRLTWMATLQGLLFAALGFAWDKKDTRELLWVLSAVGLLTSLSSMRALKAGASAIESLVSWWDKNHQQGYAGPDIIGIRSSTLWFLYPWFTFRFCSASRGFVSLS